MGKKFIRYFLILIALVLTGAAVWLYNYYYESETPFVKLSKDIQTIGRVANFKIILGDRKSGLRDITVAISQEGEKRILHSQGFKTRGTGEETVDITIDTQKLNLRDGTATIDIAAVDFSLRKNRKSVTITVAIDSTPPQIYPVSSSHYINQGGSCLSIYSLSEKSARNGILVNDDFFPSYPITIDDKLCYVSYFTIPLDIKDKKGLKLGIFAEDSAGNRAFSTIPFHIRKKNFRTDKMYISKDFLERKMPEFQQIYDNLQGKSLIETFSYVNKEIREDNFRTIQSICKNTQPRQLWDGAFLRMKNSKTMALFGDKRTYYYGGKEVSKSVHLGVDLASTRNAPVEASNSGIVVFTGYLGIYGNSIIIDHGLGLFSFYAHLGAINVKEGDNVSKGQQIARTDTSGLAVGDHLHFGIIVSGICVDPKEWWDPHWIKDNISRKMALNF
ncbi:MAG: M23 family metallopeptidase [Thermodesulfobacteriota bacterium]|nr:M23 family metallopeptidase [Thermodesulfobacteriota bacterium]